MKASMLVDIFSWLWDHKPEVAILGLVLFAGIWMTLKISKFIDRVTKTEGLCHDMHDKQLPEIRQEMKEFKKELFEIKLFMKKIDTYLSITSSKYRGD